MSEPNKLSGKELLRKHYYFLTEGNALTRIEEYIKPPEYVGKHCHRDIFEQTSINDNLPFDEPAFRASEMINAILSMRFGVQKPNLITELESGYAALVEMREEAIESLNTYIEHLGTSTKQHVSADRLLSLSKLPFEELTQDQQEERLSFLEQSASNGVETSKEIINAVNLIEPILEAAISDFKAQQKAPELPPK